MVKKIINCPSGHGTMEIQKSHKDMKFRDVDITFESVYYVCSVCGLEASSIDQASATQRAISDAYREKVGLLTSEEIQQGRKRLGLTQDGLAKNMNSGIASIKRWEKGSIQSKSMDTALRGALEHKEKIHQREKVASNVSAMNLTDAWNGSTIGAMLDMHSLRRVTHAEPLLSDASTHINVTARWRGDVSANSEGDIGFLLDTLTSSSQVLRDAA